MLGFAIVRTTRQKYGQGLRVEVATQYFLIRRTMDSTVAEDIRNDNVRAAPESIENADSVFAIRNSGSITVTPAAGLPLHDGHDDDRPALEPRPFLQLREGWPQSALDTDGASDRSLVICTIDFQILTGGFWWA